MTKILYLVEVDSGCTDHGSALIFDSIWSTREEAEAYSEQFKTSGAFGAPWYYEITEVTLDAES